MGRRGPPKTPTRLNLVRGNPAHRPINRREPQPTGVAHCPRELDAVAKREWARVLPKLRGLGLVTPIDRAALAAYCQTWARWVAAEQKLQEFGAIIKSPNGYPMLSPYLILANTAMQQMRGFLQEFGMSPAARSRIAVEQASDGDHDELAAFRSAHPRRRPA